MFTPNIISHPESFSLEQERIHAIFAAVSSLVPRAQEGSVNIAFLSDTEIQTLNREYRGIDKTTDVLSFHYFDDFAEVSVADIAGEIVLSESRIISQSDEHGHSREIETAILILHGVLHILGFDHETDEDYAEMWKYEKPLRDNLSLQ